jgi:probable HAF family extracellular repeat protein
MRFTSCFFIALAACSVDAPTDSTPATPPLNEPDLAVSVAGSTVSVVDIGVPLDGSSSYTHGINLSGQVAGTSYYGPGFQARGFLWLDGAATALMPLPGQEVSEGTDINDQGEVVGHSCCSGGRRGVVWQDGVIVRVLPPLPGHQGTEAVGINNRGETVGRSYPADPYYSWTHAVLWAPDGSVTDLGVLPGGNLSDAGGINDAGQVSGWPYSADGPRAFLWSSGTMVPLSPLSGYDASFAGRVNASGAVAGYSQR